MMETEALDLSNWLNAEDREEWTSQISKFLTPNELEKW